MDEFKARLQERRGNKNGQGETNAAGETPKETARAASEMTMRLVAVRANRIPLKALMLLGVWTQSSRNV